MYLNPKNKNILRIFEAEIVYVLRTSILSSTELDVKSVHHRQRSAESFTEHESEARGIPAPFDSNDDKVQFSENLLRHR